MNSGSYTSSESQTFSIADARYLASRIKTGLTYLRLYCGHISEQYVENLTLEAAILLKYGLLERVVYGYKRNGEVKYALIFTVNHLGQLVAADDNPSILDLPPYMEDTTFFTFLTKRHNPELTQADRDAIEGILPIQRDTGTEPSMINGTTSTADSYYRNGYGMTRSTYTSI